jgi:alpha-D-ribose 1-methylphosphonate 5-triphosphate synthase subunit PhnH
MAIETGTPSVPRQSVVADQEQRAFRALLDAMSRPGTTHALPAARPADGVWGSALVIMQCLLDHEVTFAVEADDRSVHEQILRRTGARSAALAAADYVLSDAAHAVDVIEMVSEGYFEEPERSATVVVLVDAVGSGSLRAVLSGPGIQTVQPLEIDGLDAAALRALVERNAVYPTGIDTILVDPQGRVACLPRSTRIELED